MDPWFGPAPAGGDADLTVFCLPHAGGGPSLFRALVRAAPAGIAVEPVHLPGRERRIGEPARPDVGAVADALLRRTGGPYAVLGQSMGARIGFEVVRELRRRGARPPVRLHVVAARPPDRTDPLASIAALPDNRFVARLAELGGIPAGVLAEPELRELLLPVFRADFGWLSDYRYVEEEPLPVPIVAVAAEGDPLAPPDLAAGWERQTAAGFRLVRVPGGHFVLPDGAALVAGLLAAELVP